MKKYIIYHYTVGDYYLACVKSWWPFKYLKTWLNHGPDRHTRSYGERFDSMKEAEMAIREYHEFRYQSTVLSFDMIINEGLLKKKKKGYDKKRIEASIERKKI